MSGPLWDTKQRQGHPLHRICAFQGSFPPQLPAYFLDHYKGDVVLDPFCGRGTTILEAALRGKFTLGYDLLDTARILSMVKLRCPSREDVLDEIERLDLNKMAAPAIPDDFADLYHPETWRELWNLRMTQKSIALTALALGKLHGHSPGFFSSVTFNVVSLRPERLKKMREKHGSELPYRDVKKLLRKAAGRFIPLAPHAGNGTIGNADARRLPLGDCCVDLVITSPPFLDVIDYPDVNWVRQWFLGAPDQFGKEPFIFRSKDSYCNFIRNVLLELRRVVKPGGTIVFEVGPVKKEAKLVSIVTDAAQGILQLGGVVVNSFKGEELEKSGKKSVPKISRAMRKDEEAGKETTTMANQCVVLFRT